MMLLIISSINDGNSRLAGGGTKMSHLGKALRKQTPAVAGYKWKKKKKKKMVVVSTNAGWAY